MNDRWRVAAAFSTLALVAGGGPFLSGPVAMLAAAVGVSGVCLLWRFADRRLATVGTTAPAPEPAAAPAEDAWLRMALRDVSDAVVQCGLDHRILSFNEAARRMFNIVPGASPSLAALLSANSLDHGRDCLLARFEGLGQPKPEALGDMVLVAAAVLSQSLFKGQMFLVFDAQHQPSGYLATFRKTAERALDGHPSEAANAALIRDLRGRLGSLCGAAQALADFPEMSCTQRSTFTEVINQEYQKILPRIDQLTIAEADEGPSAWLLGDLHFTELFASVSRTLSQRLDLSLRMEGIPLWLRADSLSLREALLALFAHLHAHTRQYQFDLECMLSDRHIFIDINWQGAPIPEQMLGDWLKSEINTPIGPCRAQDVFDRHDSEPWSLAKPRGESTLRIPLPLPRRPQFSAETDQVAVQRGIGRAAVKTDV